MNRVLRLRARKGLLALTLLLIGSAGWLLFARKTEQLRPQFMSAEPFSPADGQMCEWVPATASQSPDRKGGGIEGTGNREQGTVSEFGIRNSEFAAPETQHPTPSTRERALALAALSAAALQEPSTAATSAAARTPVQVDRPPERVIRDTYPSYGAVAVDNRSNEVFLQDENLFGYKVFNRLDNTPPSATFTEPKRAVGGRKTKLEYNCNIYVDPNNGDVYTLSSDTMDTLSVFPHDANGDLEPMRELLTPQATFGMAVDDDHQELFMTVQQTSSVVAYRKQATGKEAPLRQLIGDSTQLADPHGIAVDPKNDLLFVNNAGSTHSWNGLKAVPASGRFSPPAITVYHLKASGDTAPLRVIQGPKTQLNWAAGMYVDEEHGELYVANDGASSILVFRETDAGDVAPVRVLSGSKTGLKNPTGLFVDKKNQELWVANLGNHTATVFPRAANGDVAPLRTIRSAPPGQLSLTFANPSSIGYDSKRDQILVPN